MSLAFLSNGSCPWVNILVAYCCMTLKQALWNVCLQSQPGNIYSYSLALRLNSWTRRLEYLLHYFPNYTSCRVRWAYFSVHSYALMERRMQSITLCYWSLSPSKYITLTLRKRYTKQCILYLKTHLQYVVASTTSQNLADIKSKNVCFADGYKGDEEFHLYSDQLDVQPLLSMDRLHEGM